MSLTPKYRFNVGLCVVNHEGQVFVAKRIDTPGPAWQMPQGGIDEGEDPVKAGFRELNEETGITSVTLLATYPDWISYDFPEALQERLWGGGYKGQKQQWLLLKFHGSDSEIQLNQPHAEFSAYAWVNPKEVPSLAVDFKQAVYEQVMTYFHPFIQNQQME